MNVNDPDASDNADRAGDHAQDEAPAEVLSGRPVGRRFSDVVVMVTRDDLKQLFDSRTADEPPPPPTTVDEFRAVLKAVEGLGWTWTTDDPPALIPKTPENQDLSALTELSKKHPRFPSELAEVVKYALWGWKTDSTVVGPIAALEAKAAIASEMLLTDDYRSGFFFDHATQFRRFYDLDWEVMIKAAERNLRRVPGTVYATISLETSETQSDFDERRHTTLFAADGRALKRMIELLGDALKALEGAKTLAHNMRREEGGSNVK
jgi:hypothetical protein